MIKLKVFFMWILAIWLLWFMGFLFLLSINEKLRNDIKATQLSMELMKPLSTTWNYNNTWRPIGDASMKHKIYSAYFDKRTEIIANPTKDNQITIGSIRIFAVLPLNFKDEISCILRSEDYLLFEVKAEEVKALHEHHDQNYAAFAVVCPLYQEHKANLKVKLPQAVAVQYMTNKLSHISPTFIPISYPRDMEQLFAQSKPVLSVCVGPLQQNYTNVLRIVEFVEMYRIMGATHFYFYNMDCSPDVMRVLKFYREKGLADILDWNLKDHLEDLHYGGIVAQYNDCVYRANIVDNYRYAAIVDFDEILMPFKHNSLLHFLLQCDEGLTSAFVFRNVFFYKKDSDDKFSTPERAINRGLYTQTKIRRNLEILPAYTRSKCIANTRAIVEMGNHQVWRAAPGYSDHVIHPQVGLLFHYRDKCINCKAILAMDYTARKYGSLIWDRVDEVCLHVFLNLKGVCPSN
ncbi:beta-1,4-galactosyltransferase galt-1 isoform 2-T2 [Cochliomyia hominivorax]